MERYTFKDCEGLLARIIDNRRADVPGIERLFVQREAGVYRMRLRALPPGSWESDISPACTTARELWLYLRGLMDGIGLVEQIRFHTLADAEHLRREETDH